MAMDNITNWFKGQTTNKPLGTSLSTDANIKDELDKMQGSISKTSKTYQDNLKKYKEVARFNQHLTKSYMANLKVIVDVSELLNSYAGVFDSMKTEFSKMDSALGKGLDLSDFEYLQNLTKAKIDDLNLQFSKQAEGLKRLYSQYGKPEEFNRILLAQSELQKMIENAGETYKTLSEQPSSVNPGQMGGKKKRASTTNTRKNKTQVKSRKAKKTT
jgi:hypothetical protein